MLCFQIPGDNRTTPCFGESAYAEKQDSCALPVGSNVRAACKRRYFHRNTAGIYAAGAGKSVFSVPFPIRAQKRNNFFPVNLFGSCIGLPVCSRSKFLTKLLKTFDKTFREIFPVFISTKRREKPSAFFDNNFVNNAYFSEAASSSSSHLASSSSKAPISSRMTCLCLWSS